MAELGLKKQSGFGHVKPGTFSSKWPQLGQLGAWAASMHPSEQPQRTAGLSLMSEFSRFDIFSLRALYNHHYLIKKKSIFIHFTLKVRNREAQSKGALILQVKKEHQSQREA